MSTLMLLLAAAMFVLVRNHILCEVRVNLIYEGGDRWEERLYHRLPAYHSMLLSPRYFGLWTTKQWRQWVAEQRGADL